MRASWQERFAEASDVLKSDKHQQTVVRVLDLEIGGRDFITMAGPCSVETEQQLLTTANHVRQRGAQILRGGAFKPRSSPYAFQGHGLAGLKMLAQARAETGLAIVTEVMSEDDVPLVAEYADILQIGSRSMENYTLLEAAAKSGKPILLKRGMMATVGDLMKSAQIVLDNGNPNVILCERGIRTFDSTLRNTFDVAAIALLKQISHLPVIADPSHACGLSRTGSGAGTDWRGCGRRRADCRGAPHAGEGVERWRAVAEFCGVRRDDGVDRTVYCVTRNGGRPPGPWRQLDEGWFQSGSGLRSAAYC